MNINLKVSHQKDNDPGSKNTVLVVDDNPAGLYLTSKMLRMENYKILEASSGKEALEKILYRPDVVVLDVKMPDINGFEVCKRIKANPAIAAIPVIHLSATYLDPDSKALGLDSGADAYLTHPVEPKVLVATINAVLRIRQAENRLAEAALQWKTTFDSISDGVCLIDINGIINRCNQMFTEITEIQKEKLLGSRLSELLPEFSGFDSEYFRKVLDNHKDRKSFTSEILLNSRNYSISSSPVINPDDSCSGFVFKMSDITLLKESEAKLKKSLSELEKMNSKLIHSNKELEHFAYAASHDLQEPLRMITSFTKILTKKIDVSNDSKTKEYFDIILEASTRMQRLIHDLLEYSRVTTRETSFSLVDMEKVVNHVLQNLKIAITEKQAVITHDKLPVIWGDESQITQLIQNLLSNAIKFSRKDTAPVTHIGVRKDMSERWVFSVKDNGIGINPEFFDRIFVIFQRLHERDKFEGTGIGLAICKKIVEHHGGRIWVESIAGEGTTFLFSIPVISVDKSSVPGL